MQRNISDQRSATYTLLLSVIAVIGLGSLKTVDASEYLPIEIGTKWEAKAVFEGPDGRVSTGKARRTMEETVVRGEKRYVRSRSVLEGGGFPKQEYTKLVRKDESGFYSILENSLSEEEQMEIKLPLKIGQSWRLNSPNGPTTHRVVSKESVTVAGKLYKNAFHLRTESDSGDYKEDFWEVPGVGNVKSILKFGDWTITITLEEFTSPKNE